MSATSKQQQKLFGLALSVKRGETPRSEASEEVLNIVDSMSEKDIEDFASTSHNDLPKKVESIIRGLVRETFRNKILNESSRRSKDFFEDGKYGKELNKLFGGKFDGKKFDKFIDAIDKKATDVQFERILNFMGGQIGMNIRSYDNKPIQVFIDDLKKEVEKLYKIHTESVNEEVEQLDEKLITYSNRAPYGQVVFIAGGAGCFSSDTKIKTENGYKFIKDIQIGDSVYSYNEETKQTELKPVLEIYSYKLDELPGNQKMLELKFDNGIEIHCTENHEFYIDGKWVMAKNIEMGVEI